MFGCMSYGTRVTLADGTQEKIGKIVNQKLPVEVLTYDFERGELTTKPVTNWFDNGVAERFLQFTVERGGGNGKAQFAATENHMISTPGGWRPAGELIVGDRVLQATTERAQRRPVAGGSRRLDGRRCAVAQPFGQRCPLPLGSRRQAGRLRRLEGIDVRQRRRQSRRRTAAGAVFHDVQPLTELAELREAVYIGGKKVLSDDYLKRLTPLSLAVWYMDDGSFTLRSKGLQQRTVGGSGRVEICVEAMSADTRERLRRLSRRHLGHRGTILTPRGAGGKAVPPVPDRRDGQVPGADRSVRPPLDGVQAAAALPGAVCRRAGVRRAASGADADAHHARSPSSRRHAACTSSTSRSAARTTTSSTG